MADFIYLTRRVCRDLRTALRATTASGGTTMSLEHFEAYQRIETMLRNEQQSSDTRGGCVIHETAFYVNPELTFRLLRDLMLHVLESCTQMQVRRAVKKHIVALDEWSGTSAVEALGRVIRPAGS